MSLLIGLVGLSILFTRTITDRITIFINAHMNEYLKVSAKEIYLFTSRMSDRFQNNEFRI